MAIETNPIIQGRNLFDVLRQKLPSRKWSADIYQRLLEINELSRSMGSAGDMRTLRECLADYFQKCYPGDSIWLCTRHGGRHREMRLSGRSARGAVPELPFQRGMAESVIKTGDMLWIPDVRSSDSPACVPPDPAGVSAASLMIIPFSVAGEIVGCIEMMSRHARRYDDVERHLGLLVTGHLSSAFENVLARQELAIANARLKENDERLTRMNEQLRQLAITDDITGLFNRRRLLEQLDMETARSIRYGEVFSCLMIDIDDFKQINDTYGHPAGDDILRQTGALLRKSLRRSDFIARYGGEEFMVIMPRTDSAGAFRAAENLRSKFAAYEFILPDSTVIITISIGAASFSGHNPVDARQLIIQADEALYRAKGQGKNRTCFAGHRYSELPESEYWQEGMTGLTHYAATN